MKVSILQEGRVYLRIGIRQDEDDEIVVNI